jgi:hypothetical protein
MDKTPTMGAERFEVKFAGHASSIDILETWIRTHRAGFIEPYPPRIVNSTYFDTYSLGAFEENLTGVSSREKVRLRWYGRDPETDRSTLEVKLRRNKLGWKLSYPVSGVPHRDGTWRDLQSRVRGQLPPDARVRFDAHPLVSLVNRYHRRYFQSGDGCIRVTVDSDLRAFDQRFGRRPHFDRSIDLPDVLVIEFKFSPQHRASAMDSMRGIPLRVSRSSKYAIACSSIAAT